MISQTRALDTNVLVRFLVGDDPAQLKKVIALFDSASASGERFWVSSIVLLELLWVLESLYKVPRATLLSTLEQLSDLAVIQLEDAPLLPYFLSIAHTSSMELSDLLIAVRSHKSSGHVTLTFDRKAAKHSKGIMELV